MLYVDINIGGIDSYERKKDRTVVNNIEVLPITTENLLPLKACGGAHRFRLPILPILH